MPIFLFNVQNGNGWLMDKDGTELPDVDAAKAHGFAVARELMNRDEVRRRHWRLNVWDSEGALVVAIPFAKVDPLLDHLSRPLRQTVEQLAERRGTLAETMSEAKRLQLQLRSMRARSKRRPYLIAQQGEQAL